MGDESDSVCEWGEYYETAMERESTRDHVTAQGRAADAERISQLIAAGVKLQTVADNALAEVARLRSELDHERSNVAMLNKANGRLEEELEYARNGWVKYG